MVGKYLGKGTFIFKIIWKKFRENGYMLKGNNKN